VSRDTGVCLTIPEGAVRHGCNVEIFLAVLRDDRDRPKLSGPYFTRIDILLLFFKCLFNALGSKGSRGLKAKQKKARKSYRASVVQCKVSAYAPSCRRCVATYWKDQTLR